MKVLIVLTSHDQLSNTGRKTASGSKELAAPYYTFKDAGADIVLWPRPKAGNRRWTRSNEPSFQTEFTHR